MKLKRIHISEPHYSESILKYVNDAFLRNEISNYGKNIDDFEISLRDYLNTNREVVVLNSGTAAIHLALILSNVSQDDEVLCQSTTYAASVNPVVYQHAIPVFVGSEKDTWNICPKALEEAIKDRISQGKKPKAIIVVHSYGMPAKMDEIIALAYQYEITLIEDAAEALGSSYKGQKCGTFGDYGVLSFNGNKIITTSGGGALICKSEEEKQQTIFYATQARDNASHYEHSKIGYNYRMSNISAGIGRGQMEVLDKHISLRQKMNTFYTEVFKNIEGVEVQKEQNSNFHSNFWLSCILIHDEAPFTRKEFQEAMENANIETRPLWKPMHLQPIFKDSSYYGNRESETLFAKGLCLPSGSNLTDNDKDRITTVVNTLLKS